ncbi:hypothetical protein DFH11DRAFT_1546884 [Phellopilus nigrolimitatus]|nr:hypothetical protein DFH11DRAFT_1546884 [Phellopilus nigrolimitatus]
MSEILFWMLTPLAARCRMLSQDQLDSYSLYLIFGAKSPENGNRTIWIAWRTSHDNILFFKCSQGPRSSEDYFSVYRGKDPGMELHHAYRLSKNRLTEGYEDNFFALTQDEQAAANRRYEALNNMLSGKVRSCGTKRATCIMWLAALLLEPLITSNLTLDWDLKKPGLAESAATQLFDHGNSPQTEPRIFMLSEVVKEKAKKACILS